jgi:hypothetical protein
MTNWHLLQASEEYSEGLLFAVEETSILLLDVDLEVLDPENCTFALSPKR